MATMVVVVSLVDTGPPRTSPLGIWVGVAGRVLWQWRGFVGMPLVHPNGSTRPGFCGVGTMCYLCRVYNLSIAESTVTDNS